MAKVFEKSLIKRKTPWLDLTTLWPEFDPVTNWVGVKLLMGKAYFAVQTAAPDDNFSGWPVSSGGEFSSNSGEKIWIKCREKDSIISGSSA